MPGGSVVLRSFDFANCSAQRSAVHYDKKDDVLTWRRSSGARSTRSSWHLRLCSVRRMSPSTSCSRGAAASPAAGRLAHACVHMHACRPRFRRFIHYLKIYLKIRIDLMRREGNAICTSQLCRWNQPKKAPKRDLALRPLKELNCFQADPTNAGSPPAGALRAVLVGADGGYLRV